MTTDQQPKKSPLAHYGTRMLVFGGLTWLLLFILYFAIAGAYNTLIGGQGQVWYGLVALLGIVLLSRTAWILYRRMERSGWFEHGEFPRPRTEDDAA